MKTNKQIQKSEVLKMQIWGLLILTIFILNTNVQAIEISGVISTSTTPVSSAAVSFIDNSDTTKKFIALTDNSGRYSLSIVTSVEQNDNQPVSFVLEQNYPNPFLSSTNILYRINKPSDIQITIFDILGREVRRYVMGVKPAGAYTIRWDGLGNHGEKVATGIYFYRLQAGDKTLIRKMVFGMGVRNSPGSLPKSITSQAPGMEKRVNGFLQATDFTVRIENTIDTYPTIVPKQISNVIVQNDTTLNFTVEEYDPYIATVYLDSLKQIIRGFGAANILRWRPDMTADNINKAFGTGDGQIGLTILRLRIPVVASDFSDNIPTALAAHSLGVKIIASPWSPPASMKTNNSTIGGRLRESSYAAYAEHLKSFADYMESNGVPLYAISVQNEPDVEVTYESCDWNAPEMLKFVKENAATIGTDIIVPESFNFNHTISDSILNDSTAAAHVAIIGGHIYGGGLESYPLAESKGKEVWMTEHLDTNTSWASVLATGKEIHDCMSAGMNAYIWWYIVRFYGPIHEEGYVTKRGYVMSQFARFVRPGYIRVFTECLRSQLYVTAYRNDSNIVIVAVNNSSQPVDQTFVLKDGEVSSFTPYVTSNSDDCVRENGITVSGDTLRATLAGSSITTFVSE